MNRKITDFRLVELIRITDAFLEFNKSLNRKLTDDERRTNRWIADAWEKKTICAECRSLSQSTKDDICFKIDQLREIIYPTSIRRKRIVRSPEPKSDDGLHELIVVKDWTMTDKEAGDRLVLLRRLITSTTHVLKELSLHEASSRGLLMGRSLREFQAYAKRLARKIKRSADKVPNQRSIENAV